MKHRVLKNILISGMSLLLLSSLSSSPVSAHRHYHRHIRVTRVKRNRYLSFNQLIKDMNYNYNNDSSKYTKAIMSTVQHNLSHYSNYQLYKIGHNADQADLYTDQDGYKLGQAVQNRYFNKTRRLSRLAKQDNRFDTTLRANLIKDINNSRIQNGLNPLQVNSIAQMTANYRAPKVQYAYDHYNNYAQYDTNNTSNPSDNWVHGYSNHTSGSDYLDSQKYDYNEWGANACTWQKGHIENGDGTPLAYPTNTPQGVAHNIDNNFMNHDMSEGNNNYHRDNELSSDWKYVGVGVRYNPRTQEGSVNEQFIG